MQIKTYKVYKFDELTLEQQDDAVEKLSDINVDYTRWDDWILEDFTIETEELGYKNIKCYYSGFCSQGDGACFTADVNIADWIKTHKASTRFKKLLTAVKKGYWANMIITHNYRYHYANSTDVAFEGQDDIGDKAYSQLEEMAEWVKEERVELGNKLYKELEHAFFYLTGKDAIIETIRANDYEFTENGAIA